MQEKIEGIKAKYLEQILEASELKRLDELFLELFGKSGEITLFPKEFPNLAKEELRVVAPLFSQTKTELESLIEQRRKEIREEAYGKLDSETMDLSKQIEVKERKGHLHPITKFEKDIADLFAKLGFQQFDSTQIDSDFNNFEVLNIPAEHPARDLWDTLYVDQNYSGGKLLLRTHTSNSQIHVMKEFAPPLREMIIGRCFRYENLDARHEHTFDQFEIVYIDKGLSMANLQYLSEYFLKHMFGSDIAVRLKPGYYPFTEPSAGIQGQCIFCKGEGCKICGNLGWLELAGAGMMHPQVLRNGGIDPEEYSGIAWGVGPGRMAMLKYGVTDLRDFLSGDLKFLEEIDK